MKEVTIKIQLLVEDGQPVQDWIIETIEEQLERDEEILSYTDNEAIVKT